MTTVHLVNPSALVTVEIKKHLGKNSFQLVSAVVTSVLLPYTYANLLSVCNGLLSDLPRIPLNLGSRSIWNLLMYSNSSSVPSTFAILTSCQSKTRTTETLHYLQLSIIKVVCKWSWFARQFVKNWHSWRRHTWLVIVRRSCTQCCDVPLFFLKAKVNIVPYSTQALGLELDWGL